MAPRAQPTPASITDSGRLSRLAKGGSRLVRASRPVMPRMETAISGMGKEGAALSGRLCGTGATYRRHPDAARKPRGSSFDVSTCWWMRRRLSRSGCQAWEAVAGEVVIDDGADLDGPVVPRASPTISSSRLAASQTLRIQTRRLLKEVNGMAVRFR